MPKVKTSIFLLACALSVLLACAYGLYQKGLLTKDVLRLYLPQEKQKAEPGASEPMGLAASLQEKGKRLEQRNREAEQLEQRIAQQRRELQLELAKLNKLTRGPEKQPSLELQPAQDDGRLRDLIKIYEGMEPEEAAALLEQLPDEAVAGILLQMRRRQASQVMQALSTGKGVAVSARILPDIAKM
jgi:flagellar motility protein MotE (MotC chaperone)